MKVRESELPGIGQKIEIETRSDDKIAIVIHDDGRREIYHFNDEDREECTSTVTFNDTEARQISAILGGLVYKPKALEQVEVAIDELIIEWFKVEKQSDAVHKTIGDLDVRQNYGVTIIAIIKKDQKKILSPGPETVINEGDTLVISGERKELKKLIREKLTN